MRKQLAVVGVLVAALAWTMAVANAQRLGGGGPGGGQVQDQGPGQGPGQGFGRMGGGPGGPGGRGGGMFGRGGAPGIMLAGLDLTAEQQTQVKQLFESERDANQAGMQALGEARGALHAAIFASTVDTAAVTALQQKIVAAEQAQLTREVQTQLTLAGILTPEQRAKVLEHRGPDGPGGLMGRGGRLGRGLRR